MEKFFKRYVSLIVLEPALSTEVAKVVLAKLEEEVKKVDGEFEPEIFLGNKQLAYLIKGHRTGNFYQCYYKIPDTKNLGDIVAEIKRKISSKLNAEVLRHLILRADHEKTIVTLKEFKEFQC